MVKISPEFSPGTVFDGKYRLERRIGVGGMGEVYEATHVELGRKVAIKTLISAYSGNDVSVARFHQEARLASTIGDDHICEVLDIGRHEKRTPYLVMPLLPGRTLGELVREEPLPLRRLLDIVDQILRALKAAHQENIVHRDLKPNNIFITRVGRRDDFVKLLDFGVSKVLEPQATGGLTQTGAVPGTSYYMAPEQAVGLKTIDHRVDLYAVGVILYEVLTGRRPFVGDSYNEIMHKIATEPFLSPCLINPTIPKELEQVILKAMSRSPSLRYRDADEMRAALDLDFQDCDQGIMATSMDVSTAFASAAPSPFDAGETAFSDDTPVAVSGTTQPGDSPVPWIRKSVSKLFFGAIVLGTLIGLALYFQQGNQVSENGNRSSRVSPKHVTAFPALAPSPMAGQRDTSSDVSESTEKLAPLPHGVQSVSEIPEETKPVSSNNPSEPTRRIPAKLKKDKTRRARKGRALRKRPGTTARRAAAAQATDRAEPVVGPNESEIITDYGE